MPGEVADRQESALGVPGQGYSHNAIGPGHDGGRLLGLASGSALDPAIGYQLGDYPSEHLNEKLGAAA